MNDKNVESINLTPAQFDSLLSQFDRWDVEKGFVKKALEMTAVPLLSVESESTTFSQAENRWRSAPDVAIEAAEFRAMIQYAAKIFDVLEALTDLFPYALGKNDEVSQMLIIRAMAVAILKAEEDS